MTGGNPNKGKHHSSAASNRKSKWESSNNNPPKPAAPNTDTKPTTANTTTATNANTKPSTSKPSPSSKPGPSRPQPDPSGPGILPPPNSLPPFPQPEPAVSDPLGLGPLPPPAYGFHMLERRTFFLADGSVRSYFALPPDYQDFPPQQLRQPLGEERFLPFGGPGGPPGGLPGGGLPGPPGREFDRHFPLGGRMSPESFRREERERELQHEREREIYGRAVGGGGAGQHDYWNSLGLDGRGGGAEGALKRKFGDEGDERDMRDELARQRQKLLQYGNSSADGERPGFFGGGPSGLFGRDMMDVGRGGEDFRMRMGGEYDFGGGRGVGGGDLGDVDPQALNKAFLQYVKSIYEDAALKEKYLEDGKAGPLQCLACGRASKDFPDVHAVIMHAYNSNSADLHVDHRGFHKALCVLMGWSYGKAPDNLKAYQSLSTDEAEANKDDLILWPPVVIIHNTNTGRGKEGRMEGLGNKVMDNKLQKDFGIVGGKSKSLYGKDGHQGTTLVKFAGDKSALKEAARLEDYFEKDNHGRKGWAHALATQSGRDDESNPNLLKMDVKTGEKKRIFYGYMATASDLEKVDADTRKKTSVKSKKEFKA